MISMLTKHGLWITRLLDSGWIQLYWREANKMLNIYRNWLIRSKVCQIYSIRGNSVPVNKLYITVKNVNSSFVLNKQIKINKYSNFPPTAIIFFASPLSVYQNGALRGVYYFSASDLFWLKFWHLLTRIFLSCNKLLHF